MLLLPKKYLSYSQVNLWLKNKDQYRRRYYLGEKIPENPEMIFGKKIAKMMEDHEAIKLHPVLSTIPHYSVSEHGIKTEIDGIPIIGYLDSYCPETKSFYEYKTSHTDSWNKVSVRKHEQLPFYSLLVELTEGEVNRTCHLIWIETRFKDKTEEFEGHTLTASTRNLELTGRVEVFKRIIYKWERERIKKLIINVANEISQDYTKWIQTFQTGTVI